MSAARVGLFVHNGRLSVVAVTGRERVEHFVVENAEDPAGTLAAELTARGLAGRRLRVGLNRRQVVVKAIDLPRTAGNDLARMIGFDLERHVPFPPENARFDWVQLPSAPEGPRRVLVAAAERRTVERSLALLAGAKRRPATLTVACHDLIALLPRVLAARRTVWAHRHGGVADLLFLDDRALLTSRQVIAADAETLAREIQRSLELVRWSSCDTVWLSGDDAEFWRADLVASFGMAVSAPPYAEPWVRHIAALPVGDEGAALLALAVTAGPRRPALDLLPVEARPWTPSREQLVTASMVAVTALLGLSFSLTHVIKTERYLGRLTQEIRRLEPEAKTVDRLAAELAGKRRVLAALESAEAGHIQALPVLRELTETLPASAWLQALAMDRQGLELTGQSDAASALIPLLEASSQLERVEFTSPVTKAQNKEQFRIRAAWETPHPTLAPDGKASIGSSPASSVLPERSGPPGSPRAPGGGRAR
jgi:Tfp pilus assembly protein PilN